MVNVVQPVKILLLRPKSTIQKVVPIGLLYLSAHLKKEFPEIQIRLVDFRLDEAKSYDRLPVYLDGFVPDVVGISSLTLELLEAIDLAKQCKNFWPKAACILGGPASSADYGVIEPLQVFDRIVVGEGEEVFRQIVAGTIPEDRMTLQAEDFPPVDVNHVELPDYSLVHLPDYFLRNNSHEAFQRFRQYAPIFTSRGCPFDCGFCFHVFGKKVRFRKIEHVCREVEFLVSNYGVREVHIEDDVFNLDIDRAREFFAFLDRKGLRLAISFPNGIIYKTISEAVARMFKAGGVYRISLGIESASPRIMELISKKHDLEKLDQAIRYFDRQHILTHGFLITGFPTETEQDLDETIRFILKSRLHTFRYSYYVPFRGTPLYQQFQTLFEKHGLDDTRNARYSAGKVFSEVEKETIDKKIKGCSRQFYLNPLRVFRIFTAMDKKVMMLFIMRKTRQVWGKLANRAGAPSSNQVRP